MSRARPKSLWRDLAALTVVALTSATAVAAWAAPQLHARARQLRVPAASVGFVKLWDTTWWIDVRATPNGPQVIAIDYRARFSDSGDSGVQSGTLEIVAEATAAVEGRINVICASRTDYDRSLLISLRTRDVRGGLSPWQEIALPQHAEADLPGQEEVAVQVAAPAERTTENLGSIEIIASEDMTMAEIRRTLQRHAREKGGDAAVDLKMLDSSEGKLRIQAQVLRYIDTPGPTPTRPPSDSQRVIGEIRMGSLRR